MEQKDYLNDPFGLNKEKDTPAWDEQSKQLIDEKRHWYYDFFGNKLSLVLTIIFIVSLVVAIYNYTDTLIIDFRDPTTSYGFAVITYLINVGLSVILPYGIYLVYTASKQKDQFKFTKGLDVLMLDIKIMRVVMAIASIILFVSSVMLMRFGVGGLILLVAGVLLFFLIFVILKIFADFIVELKQSFLDVRRLAPSSKAIKTYIIIVLVLDIVLLISVYLFLETLLNYLGVDLLLAGFSIGLIRLQLVFAFFILLAQIGFFLYYVIKYEAYFTEINQQLRQKIETELDREIL